MIGNQFTTNTIPQKVHVVHYVRALEPGKQSRPVFAHTHPMSALAPAGKSRRVILGVSIGR